MGRMRERASELTTGPKGKVLIFDLNLTGIIQARKKQLGHELHAAKKSGKFLPEIPGDIGRH